jgi:hypothetical protein
MSGLADGAWGLRFPQVSGAQRVLLTAPEWPAVDLEIGTNVTVDQPVDDDWDDRGMRVPLPTGGYLEVTWPATVALSLRSNPTPECLIQPHLSTAAGAIAFRSGSQPFHAGAFLVDGGAWGVLGARNAGKSSALGMLHQRGLPILTDDLLVVGDGEAFAGPRCIDLRSEAAEELATGIDLGIVGRRERWRVYLDECRRTAPMRGWVLPRWGPDDVSLVRPAQRLPSLVEHSFFQGITMNDPDQYLALASLPMIVWTRPKDWSLGGRSLDHLLDQIAATPEKATT